MGGEVGVKVGVNEGKGGRVGVTSGVAVGCAVGKLGTYKNDPGTSAFAVRQLAFFRAATLTPYCCASISKVTLEATVNFTHPSGGTQAGVGVNGFAVGGKVGRGV